MEINNTNIYLCIHKCILQDELNEIKERLKCFAEKIEVIECFKIRINRKDIYEMKKDKDCNFVIVHYGLEYDYSYFSPYDIFIESIEDIDKVLLENIIKIYQIQNKRVLLYSGKMPENSNDIDGGSQMVSQLIKCLSERCKLDVTFIRKENEKILDYKIRKIRYLNSINPMSNKFQRRFDNIVNNQKAILNGETYDLIIALHCSKLFGLENNQEIMKKTIVFPMMLTAGYRLAGESVPARYTELENDVLRNASYIITPSKEEFDCIQTEYEDIDLDKIEIIPRGISPIIKGKIHKCNRDSVNIVSVGSIKLQKNHMSEVRIVQKLKDKGFNIHLTIIGAIHDKDIYDELEEYICENDLKNNVTFKKGLNQYEMSQIFERMDIALSCSCWETFGRGIFEGITAGLPTVVSDSLTVVKRIVSNNDGVFFEKNEEAMIKRIIRLIDDGEMYKNASSCALKIAEKVSYYIERDRLLKSILYKYFGVNSKFDSWNSKECEKIYSSKNVCVYKKGCLIRKYYAGELEEKARRDFKKIKDMGGNEKNLFFSYDYENSNWFFQYEVSNE